MTENLKKIKKNADIVLASNVFAHSDELKNDGRLHVED